MIDVSATGTAPVEYRIDSRQHVVYMTMRGNVTSADLSDVLAAVRHDPAYAEGMGLYFDFRIVKSIPAHDEIRAFAIDRMLKASAGAFGKIALVAMTPLGFAFASALEDFLARPGTEVQVFTSHVKARVWMQFG